MLESKTDHSHVSAADETDQILPTNTPGFLTSVLSFVSPKPQTSHAEPGSPLKSPIQSIHS